MTNEERWGGGLSGIEVRTSHSCDRELLRTFSINELREMLGLEPITGEFLDTFTHMVIAPTPIPEPASGRWGELLRKYGAE